MVNSEVLSEQELVDLLNKATDKEIVGAKKAAHGGKVVIEYKEDN